MPTKSKSLSRDRRLISAEKHEIAYAAKKIGKNGKKAVISAKKALGHTTSRKKVMARAKSIAGRK